MEREERGGEGWGKVLKGAVGWREGGEGGRKLELGSMRREVLISIEQ